MPLPPPLSPEQRRRALEKAAEVRRNRAELKTSLKEGRITLREILERSGDDIVGRMKVASVLESLPGVGKVRALRLMKRLEISNSRRVRGLGSKQREALLREFTQK